MRVEHYVVLLFYAAFAIALCLGLARAVVRRSKADDRRRFVIIERINRAGLVLFGVMIASTIVSILLGALE